MCIESDLEEHFRRWQLKYQIDSTSRDTIDSCLISYDMAIEVSHTVDDNTTEYQLVVFVHLLIL